jgi:hypothetical protein
VGFTHDAIQLELDGNFFDLIPGERRIVTFWTDETALRLICMAQRILREQMGEESLDKILGVRGRITALTQKCVERRPIGFTKSGERLPHRFRRLVLRSTQKKGPMRRLKGSAACECKDAVVGVENLSAHPSITSIIFRRMDHVATSSTARKAF